ncbi:MAG: Gfo/Idh/MocA family oxidoreductase [Lentisphaeria bacterium]
MSNFVKFGILGCGPRGMQMARVLQLLPDLAALCAMSDTDPVNLKKASREFSGVSFYDSSDALIESGLVDAVITEIPPAVHTEYVVKALDCGIHVLGEIPAVDSLEEGRLLWEKVNSSRALYMCGSNPHYRAKTALLIKLKEKGLIGKVAYIETEYMHDMRTCNDEWRKTYETCRYCTHSLGPVLRLLDNDEFISVACMSTGDHFNCGRDHNAMSALLKTRKNVVVRFLTGFALPYAGPAHTTKIYSEKGILELRNESARIWLEDLNGFSARREFLEIPLTPQSSDRPGTMKILDEGLFRAASYGHNGSDLLMVRDFVEAIWKGSLSPIGVKDALAMTLPGIYAALSAREGGAIQQIKYPWT